MITFKNENNVIRILRNDERLYTVSQKTYAYLNERGMGCDHVITLIEQLHKTKLHTDDITKIKSYFEQVV